MSSVLDRDSNSFSNRIRSHARLAEAWSPRNNSNACVWAIDDQLLLTEDVSPFGPGIPASGIPVPGTPQASVKDWLDNNNVTYSLVVSLFDDIARRLPATKDVHVVQIGLPPGADVFWAVNGLRSVVPGFERSVSPNHVLVPAWNGDACPYGPPREFDGGIPANLPVGVVKGNANVEITLIDSGYCWDGAWGANPLDALLGHSQDPPNMGSYPDQGAWPRFASEAPDHNGKLDALAGHANFVAGILAQRCQATIDIWNLNSSYIGNDLAGVPTEASVLRAVMESQDKKPAPVIVITYAFPPYEGVVSNAWDSIVTEALHRSQKAVIVCPVGNQGTSQRRYPAALATVDPNPAYPGSANVAYERVIGVGSLNDDTKRGSDFSNRGGRKVRSLSLFGRRPAPDPWVSASAIGERVFSTYLESDLPTEDEPMPLGSPATLHDFKANNSWAAWQGTCFAAPKIAAAIANELQNTGGEALTAWNNVKATGQPDPAREFGLMFPQL